MEGCETCGWVVIPKNPKNDEDFGCSYNRVFSSFPLRECWKPKGTLMVEDEA